MPHILYHKVQYFVRIMGNDKVGVGTLKSRLISGLHTEKKNYLRKEDKCSLISCEDQCKRKRK